MAANRAFLKGIGLKPSAMQDGLINPVDPADPLVLQSARTLAARAAIAQAERQVWPYIPNTALGQAGN